MAFGLKNVGAIYQRLMVRIVAPRIGQNVQAYVDDMVITSEEKDQHVADLEELFTTIAKYNIKFNPEKCAFGVEAGKFLGFLLTKRGIEANPDKCETIIRIRSPATVKEVQQLIGRMVALSRFLSVGGDKGYSYFQCLTKSNCFTWTRKCKEKFLKLKEYLANPHVLCKPLPGTRYSHLSLFCSHRSSNQLGHCARAGSSSETNILREQGAAGAKGSIFQSARSSISLM